jgi:hypothetical protein
MKLLTTQYFTEDEGPWWTLTAEGYIKGINVCGYECVVKTEIQGKDTDLPKPKRTRGGELIFAVPGGGSYTEGRFLDD